MKQSELLKAIEFVIYRYYNYYNVYAIEKNDLVQVGFETFYSVKKKTGKIPSDDELFSRLRYEIGTYINKNKPKNVVLLDEDLLDNDFIPESIDDPATRNELTDAWEKLGKGMESLSERERHLIYSHYLAANPKSVDTLAKELKLSKQRIYAILRQAEDKLAQAIGEYR